MLRFPGDFGGELTRSTLSIRPDSANFPWLSPNWRPQDWPHGRISVSCDLWEDPVQR